jgi:hypothetical protein
VGVAAQTRLPLRPVWWGFFVNFSVFTAIALITQLGWQRAFRVRRRSRAGLCIRCAYAVRDLPICPECGTKAHAESRKSREAISTET